MKTTKRWVAGAPEHVLELLAEPDDLPEDRDERIAYGAGIASELMDQSESRESVIVRGDN